MPDPPSSGKYGSPIPVSDGSPTSGDAGVALSVQPVSSSSATAPASALRAPCTPATLQPEHAVLRDRRYVDDDGVRVDRASAARGRRASPRTAGTPAGPAR